MNLNTNANYDYTSKATHDTFAIHQPAERQPEVLAELMKLTDQCGSLNKLVVELEERLKGVLTITQNSEAKPPSTPEPIRVPLAAAFHDRVVSLDNVMGQLSSVINRLEI